MDKYSDTVVSDVGGQDDSLASDSTESEELSEGMEYSGEEVYQDPGELISDVQDGMYDNIGTDTVEDQTFADYRESESDEDLGENDESDNFSTLELTESQFLATGFLRDQQENKEDMIASQFSPFLTCSSFCWFRLYSRINIFLVYITIDILLLNYIEIKCN